MALTRYSTDKYASLEVNLARFRHAGPVISQTKLADAFTSNSPCENGMWLDTDIHTGKIGAAAVTTGTYGIVYTSEDEYDNQKTGLKNFCQVAGDYPRVGVMDVGDVYTTNCFQYNTTEYANEATLNAILVNCATTAIYVYPVANSAVPQVSSNASLIATGLRGTVNALTTMPNGEKAIKYQITRL